MALLCPFSDMATKANTGGCRCYTSSPTHPTHGKTPRLLCPEPLTLAD